MTQPRFWRGFVMVDGMCVMRTPGTREEALLPTTPKAVLSLAKDGNHLGKGDFHNPCLSAMTQPVRPGDIGNTLDTGKIFVPNGFCL